MERYSKLPLTYSNQVELLKSRGMVILDEERVKNPPSWMSVEIMYFYHLSRICTGLKQRSDINGIASYFALPPQTFCSWLHTTFVAD